MSQVQPVKEDLKPVFWSAKRIAIMAIFIALSYVGSLIKIPSPLGTIGLDSAPGFFSALAFGAWEGAIIIAIGHLFTAAVVGFPLTIPMHLFIAALMALWALTFRWVNQKLGLIPAMIVAIFLNGVVSSFTMLPAGGMGAVLGLMPFLVLGSVINVVVSGLAYKALKKSRLF
ncbi:ECF transporter S component [Desulfitobacterium sp.]|uniref:ECF transporter S component n=1 Tax=Desulfitobacterium sp. TaxID=49981 RepID=UPI002C9B2DEA|nr:ECF transporter S component [Desulfitobacterium sp.]HVJ47622.1 ECF transporter S component [Desulfitobacterium sp.]